jgi:hypothetical protein
MTQPSIRDLLDIRHSRTLGDYSVLANLAAKDATPDVLNGKEWTEADTAELAALLAEYESLRNESLNAINNRLQLLLLALAAVGALVGGALSIDEPLKRVVAVTLMLSVAVPLMSCLVLVVWAGEAMRMKRVGHYLASDVEPRINRKIGRLVVSWEQALYTGALPRDEFSGTSMYVGVVFGLAALVAPIVGLQITGTPVTWSLIGQPLWQLWLPWSLLGITGIWLLSKSRQLVSGKDHTSVFHVDSESQTMNRAVGS